MLLRRLISLTRPVSSCVLLLAAASNGLAACNWEITVSFDNKGVYRRQDTEFDECPVNAQISPETQGHLIQFHCVYGDLRDPTTGTWKKTVGKTTDGDGAATVAYRAPTFHVVEEVTATDVSAPPPWPQDIGYLPVFEVWLEYRGVLGQLGWIGSFHEEGGHRATLYDFGMVPNDPDYRRDPNLNYYAICYKMTAYPDGGTYSYHWYLPNGCPPWSDTEDAWEHVGFVDDPLGAEPTEYFQDWYGTSSILFTREGSPSDEAEDVPIQFSYGGDTIVVLRTDVRRPATMARFHAANEAWGQGFKTYIWYRVKDQLGDSLYDYPGEGEVPQATLHFRETFDEGSEVSDWQSNPRSGGEPDDWEFYAVETVTSPNWFMDEIGMQDSFWYHWFPTPQQPSSSWDDAVDHVPQHFYLFQWSLSDHLGLLLETHSLQRYENHADHLTP